MYDKNGTYLMHYGVEGQKWGTRRWQNPDGSLTPEGRKHYGYNEKLLDKAANKLYTNKRMAKIEKATAAGKNRKLVRMAKNDINNLRANNNFARNVATRVGVTVANVAGNRAGSPVKNVASLVPVKQITLKADVAIGEEIARNYLKGKYSDETIAAALKKVNKSQKAQAITSDVLVGIGAVNVGINLATGGKQNIITAPINLGVKAANKHTVNKEWKSNEKMFKERDRQNSDDYGTPNYSDTGKKMSDYGDTYKYDHVYDNENPYKKEDTFEDWRRRAIDA